MWSKLSEILLANRLKFIIGTLLCTLLVSTQIAKVEMSYESADLLPRDDSSYIMFQNFRKTFGQEGNVIVLAVQDSNFYELERINDWIAMENNIAKIDGVTALVSITHTFNLNKDNENNKFTIDPIFPDHINSQQELDSLVNIVDNLPFYDGMLINKANSTYAMMVTISAEVMGSPKRVDLVNSLKSYSETYADKYDVKIRYSGMPYIRVVNAEMIKAEMYLFIFLSLLITNIVLYLFFKSYRIVFFCSCIVMISVLWTLSFLGMLGVKITLLTAMLPPLIIVISIPNCVYMINKYHAEFMKHGDKMQALKAIVSKVGNATLFSNLTTAAGFATFMITESRVLVEFGQVALLSIIMIFIVSIILIPTVFSYLPVPETKHVKHLDNPLVSKSLKRLVSAILRHRHTIYYATILIVFVCGIGVSLMKTTGYMVDDLQDDDPIKQDLAFFEENFDGLMPLEVTVDTKKPKQVLSISNLTKLDTLQARLSRDADISKPISLIAVAKFANQAFYNGKSVYYKLPTNTTKNFIMRYLGNSVGENTQGGGFNSYASSFIDSTQQTARLSFRVKDIGTKRMAEKEAFVYNTAREIFPEDKYDVKVTGSSIIHFRGNQYLIKNLFTSVLLAILLISGFIALMFRSKRMVLIALVPNLVPLIIIAAIMGFFGIPIKASTVLVFSVVFGITVDSTIHFLAKYRQELQGYGWNMSTSVIRSLKETGQSVIYNSIILLCGFGIFCLSDFGGTFALGALTCTALFAAMVSNLFLLPALLLTMQKSVARKIFKSEPLWQILEEENDMDINKLKLEEDK